MGIEVAQRRVVESVKDQLTVGLSTLTKAVDFRLANSITERRRKEHSENWHGNSRLIVLRGNSGAGKTTAARLLRGALREGAVDASRGYYRNDVALIEQDYIRRTLLGENDRPGGINIDVIDSAARLPLDGGFDVIIEGMLFAERYATMLITLTADHVGSTHDWYFDASLDETQRRHLGLLEVAQVPLTLLAEWYRERDLLPGLVQRVVPGHWSPAQTVSAVLAAARQHER